MASLNKVQLIGHLGKDPEVKYLPSGDAVATVSIATSESWTDKESGQKKEATEWHRVTFFGKIAEIVGEYLKKGSQCYVEGKLRTRKWKDRDGQDRYTTEINAQQLVMLGRPKDGQPGQQSTQRNDTGSNAYRDAKEGRTPVTAAPKKGGDFEQMNDDIPF